MYITILSQRSFSTRASRAALWLEKQRLIRSYNIIIIIVLRSFFTTDHHHCRRRRRYFLSTCPWPPDLYSTVNATDHYQNPSDYTTNCTTTTSSNTTGAENTTNNH